MRDRRRKLRKHLIFFLKVHIEGGRYLGQLVDISPLGLKLVGEVPCEVGRAYKLEVALPQQCFAKQGLKLEAECVWSHPDIRPGQYATGFSIMALGNLKELKIEDVIEALFQEYVFEG